jgi:hypothetical protein
MTGSLLCQRINGNGVTEALVADVGQERRLRGRVSVPAASCDHSGCLMRATVTSAPILFSSVLVHWYVLSRQNASRADSALRVRYASRISLVQDIVQVLCTLHLRQI